MNSRKRRAQRYRDKCAAERRFWLTISSALSGCSEATIRALSLPSFHKKQHSGSCCLPQVAMFRTGKRKSHNITAR